jgi:hypothetical protein
MEMYEGHLSLPEVAMPSVTDFLYAYEKAHIYCRKFGKLRKCQYRILKCLIII